MVFFSENLTAVHVGHLGPVEVVGFVASQVGSYAVLGFAEHPLNHETFGIVCYIAEALLDFGSGQGTIPYACVVEVTVEELRDRIVATVGIP